MYKMKAVKPWFPKSFCYHWFLRGTQKRRHVEGYSEDEVWLDGWRQERFSRNFILDPIKQPARSLSTWRFWHEPQCERVEHPSICSAKHYRWRNFTPYGSIYTILPSEQNCRLHWLISRHSEMYPSFSQNKGEWTSKCFIFPFGIAVFFLFSIY